MPIVCIDGYGTYFAYASWIFGDMVLLGAFLTSQKRKVLIRQ